VSSFSSYATREPVLLYLYSVVGAILAVLVVYGIVDETTLPVILAAVSALLAVPAVETARSKVSPVDTATPEV
jgi:hypothetical protein